MKPKRRPTRPSNPIARSLRVVGKPQTKPSGKVYKRRSRSKGRDAAGPLGWIG